MRVDKYIDQFNASIVIKNYAQADKALKKIVQEKLRAKFDNEYRKIEQKFFNK